MDVEFKMFSIMCVITQIKMIDCIVKHFTDDRTWTCTVGWPQQMYSNFQLNTNNIAKMLLISFQRILSKITISKAQHFFWIILMHSSEMIEIVETQRVLILSCMIEFVGQQFLSFF